MSPHNKERDLLTIVSYILLLHHFISHRHKFFFINKTCSNYHHHHHLVCCFPNPFSISGTPTNNHSYPFCKKKCFFFTSFDHLSVCGVGNWNEDSVLPLALQFRMGYWIGMNQWLWFIFCPYWRYVQCSEGSHFGVFYFYYNWYLIRKSRF